MAFCLCTSAKLYRWLVTIKNKVNGISFCTCRSILCVSINLCKTQTPLRNTMSCNRTHPTAQHAMPIDFRCHELLVFLYFLSVLFLNRVILLRLGGASLHKFNLFLWQQFSVLASFYILLPKNIFLAVVLCKYRLH